MLLARCKILLCLLFLGMPCYGFVALDKKIKILIGSPVRQRPIILKEFLNSLVNLKKDKIILDYCFVDDNHDLESKKLLHDFSSAVDVNCSVFESSAGDDKYVCDESAHHWNEVLAWKVAEFKNFIISNAIDNDYDYLFLIDSDIVLAPSTIEHLVSLGKDIVSEVFWTRRGPDGQELPQVWQSDLGYLSADFLSLLRIPGVYEVGGLGSCTLISKEVLKSGINFSRIKNIISFKSDDHFCVKASAKGFSMYVDTHYPAYHVFRESDLRGLDRFKEKNIFVKKAKITLGMCVKNESGRYLRKVLESAREYIDSAVIIDDASTDDTAGICLDILKGVPLNIIRNSKSKFSHEIDLRQQLWSELVKSDPDWILILDADEVFEDKFKHEIGDLINREDVDLVGFRLYDFWDQEHYRDDGYWNAHKKYTPFMVRYKKDFDYKWEDSQKRSQHCWRFPLGIMSLNGQVSDLRLKHYGWSNLEDRMAKYVRYKQLDFDGKHGSLEQYESIFDENPNLVKWIE